MWIEEYEKLMFGENHTQDTMALGADLKLANMPELLFKYRPIDEHSLEALQGDFLFSSQPQIFNDPFEGPIEISIPEAKGNMYQKVYDDVRVKNSFLPNRQVKSSHDLIESIAIGFGGSYDDVARNFPDFDTIQELSRISDIKAEESIRILQRSARNMYNICCFSASNDNELMWSHYAKNHTGFCIGYGIKELNNNMTHLTFPVIYTQKGYLCINRIEDITGNLCMYALTIKSTNWSYENEWRTFFPANPPAHKEKMPTPKSVFIGAKTSATDINKLVKICECKRIPIYKMKLQLSQHSLIAESI